jgi:hypothetical protein
MSVQSLKQSQKAKRSNLAAWRAARVHDLDLPSGLRAVVRDADMTDLLLSGRLPPVIIEMAKQAAEEGKGDLDLQKIGTELMEKNSQDFLQMLDTIAKAVLVDPQIGDIADDDHITLTELPMTDKIKIMEFINRGAEQLHPFRGQSNEFVEASQSGNDVSVASK